MAQGERSVLTRRRPAATGASPAGACAAPFRSGTFKKKPEAAPQPPAAPMKTLAAATLIMVRARVWREQPRPTSVCLGRVQNFIRRLVGKYEKTAAGLPPLTDS